MVRKAKYEDIDEILEVISDAKALFRSQNSTQWQDKDGYPNRDTFLLDIRNGFLSVNDVDGTIAGVIALSRFPEKCYETIDEGNWLNDEPYYVIHRIAVRKTFYGRGIAKELIAAAEDETRKEGIHNLRADTMVGNIPMNNLLQKCGYQRCGIIYLLKESVLDKKRVAYQKIL